ncbi:glucose PTS transporter subunit EIIB [uncultured Anaerococcus sp.]|uniref:glucose PTS transporter subunit EIIB n=1 Tax=uncultured Anaerococcus sp. TaxID=293428 RepID=UPI0025D7C0B9|nr:glucose PTS transporter subunit EIIB [uncultured Anaerococcus sp.]
MIFGLPAAALYYFSFRFLITKFDIKTPGRGDEEAEETKVETKSSIRDDAVVILEALGGKENIQDVDACITRLRINLNDVDKVDRETLKRLGATGVLDVPGGVQAIYGAKAILYKNEINDILGVDD